MNKYIKALNELHQLCHDRDIEHDDETFKSTAVNLIVPGTSLYRLPYSLIKTTINN